MDEHKYPLHYASKHQQNITNLPYINHRVDINKQTDENETPLMYAAKYGHLFNLKVLIDNNEVLLKLSGPVAHSGFQRLVS
jgi:ankyrin repeat protein